jgi:hypothetical protein
MGLRIHRPRAIKTPPPCEGQKDFGIGTKIECVETKIVPQRKFILPPYERTETRNPKLRGISPREGFRDYVVPLLAKGHAEAEIDEGLVHAIQTERWWIREMLGSMQTGALRVIDEQQQDHAVEFRNTLDTLSDLATAAWYFELNTTEMLKQNPTVARRWQINSRKIRVALGKFRQNIMDQEVVLHFDRMLDKAS